MTEGIDWRAVDAADIPAWLVLRTQTFALKHRDHQETADQARDAQERLKWFSRDATLFSVLVNEMVAEWGCARKEKRYDTADSLRDLMARVGVTPEDRGKDRKPTWRRI